MILTNGQVWQAYHLTAGLPLGVDLALDVDLLGEKTLGQKVGEMFYLAIEAAKRDLPDALWKAKAATSAANLTATLLSDPVVDAIRKQVRRTSGHLTEAETVRSALRDEVIRPGQISGKGVSPALGRMVAPLGD